MNQKPSPLERYMTALEAVAGANTAGITLVELADRCLMPVGSAHRVIQTLLESGLIVKRSENAKAYTLGDRVFRLVQTAADSRVVGSAVQATLDSLATEVGEMCFVARLVARQIVSVAWATPEKSLRARIYPGDVMPANAAASAKVILAHQDVELAREVVGAAPEQLTPFTHTDRIVIEAEYAAIRRDGFATCWDEMDLGLSAIAVPILLPSGNLSFSLGVTGLTPRIRGLDLGAVHQMLVERAKVLGGIIQSAAFGRANRLDADEINRR